MADLVTVVCSLCTLINIYTTAYSTIALYNPPILTYHCRSFHLHSAGNQYGTDICRTQEC